jgi:two-component system, OmpR family, phosphate regulon sensor histidine kinase PhoR
MAIGPELSGGRWMARKAELEAWTITVWLGARRRLAIRWMPLAAATAILAVLAIFGRVDAAAALIAAGVLFAAAAFWPLDTTVLLEALAGAGRRADSTPDLDRKGWRAVVDAIPTAALALDAAGSVVHHNRLVAELFPRIRNGLPMSQVSRNPDLIAAVDRALATEDRIDVELIERVPVERRVSATVSRLGRSTAPSSPHLLVTFRDLTEQDRLAQMRADFIANASHELRTPLASLRAFVETLQGPAREDAVARERFLRLMASQAERMTRLIDDLLSLSRVEMRVHLPARGIVELNETVAYVCQSLEPVAEGAKTALSLQRDDETPARIRGDREEIVQVVQNLIQNAIKYGREGGHVDVRVGRTAARGSQGAKVWVIVGDDGPGIAPVHLPRLTERFYRVNVASSREKGGTGLGLAIVKHILNRHRGELKIASKLGVGSTFTVSFDELGGGN